VSGSRLDPILLEVLWNRLVSVVEEQARALMRTSFTSVVREAGDLSAGLFDRRGRMVAQAVTGTPGHVNAMATSVHHFLREIPAETLQEGDAMITNHPWQTSGHLNDFTVISPIFRDGDIVAYFGNCCHALDVGGRGLGADARQVYEEGLFVPVTRLFVRGEPNEELFRLVRANVRAPFEVVGDLYAQAGSNAVGGERLVEMIEAFDLEDIESLSDEIRTRSERAMREAIEALPDGVYENESYTDGFDEPIRLAVSIRVDGDEMHVDYEGSSPQSERGINVVLNYTAAYTTFGIKCAISPEVPNNDGSFQPIDVAAPEGSILNAVHPAPVGARHIVGHFLPGVIHGALAQAIPDKVLAQGADSLWNTQITGERESGEPFTYVFFSGGGMGARPTGDGLSATAFPSGIRGVPAEVIESISPVLMHRREFRPDSEGPGRHRGGFGQEMEIGVRSNSPWVLSAMYDRTRWPAQGILGGYPGGAGAVSTTDGRELHPKRQQRIEAGERVVLSLPGGGGYGDPLGRDPAQVAADAENGLVSVERARQVYGVVLKEGPGSYAPDREATDLLRTSSTTQEKSGRGDAPGGPDPCGGP
jgi:N-methylhydantoinase B